jgi:hypothetical protein
MAKERVADDLKSTIKAITISDLKLQIKELIGERLQ